MTWQEYGRHLAKYNAQRTYWQKVVRLFGATYFKRLNYATQIPPLTVRRLEVAVNYAQLVAEVQQEIAEGHTAKLSYHAIVFAYDLKPKQAQRLLEGLPESVRKEIGSAG